MNLDEFLRQHGRRGAKILSLLGKMQPFHDAIKSELGQELLKDITAQYDALIDDIVKVDCPQEKRIEFQVVSRLIEKWSERIATYNRLQTEIADIK